MTREIKFRVWDKKRKDMYLNIRLKKIYDYGASFFVDDMIWMQYTGLKDKNNKEVYFDSDIIEYTYEDGQGLEQTVVGILILELKHTLSIAVKDESGTFYCVTATDLRNCEVIGNIYENGEWFKCNKKTIRKLLG